jgi:acyl-CoA synthetase (AMP-forming)/AMP-acid ligase II
MAWEKENVTFHFVEKWAAKQPDAEALVFNDERLTWQDFKVQTDLIAKAYLDAGVEKGDRVAMLAMAGNEFMTTYMAAGKVGAMWLGLNPKSTIDELRYIIGDSKPKVLVMLRSFMDTDLSEMIIPLQKEFDFLETILVIGDAFEGSQNFHEFVQKDRSGLDDKLVAVAEQVAPADNALLMYTSGSTGKPKGVVHTHSSIIENIKVEVAAFEFNEAVRALLHFPINHVAADVEIGFGAVMTGGCLVFMDGFDPEASLKMIAKEKLTLLGQVPVMFLMQMMHPAFKETDISSLKLIAWAGAAAPKIMLDGLSAVCQKIGAQLITGYGSTEVCGFITYTKLNDDPELLLKSVGKIAPPFELKIVDNKRNPVGLGTIGEIAVRGPFMFKEYLNKPDATAEVLDSEGWYYTDDLGHVDDKGYLFITGRKSEMFKTGGENVYPREVEEVLESHPGVLFAAVIGAKDEIYQEVGWAFVMLQPGQEAKEEELVALCKEKLSNFKVPKRYFIRPLLPLLPTGKVNKIELKKEMETL